MPQAGGFRGCAGCRRSEASRLRVLGKWPTAAFSGTRRGRPSSPFPPSSLVLSLGAASLWGQLPAPGGVSPEAGLATRASAARQLGSSACAPLRPAQRRGGSGLRALAAWWHWRRRCSAQLHACHPSLGEWGCSSGLRLRLTARVGLGDLLGEVFLGGLSKPRREPDR